MTVKVPITIVSDFSHDTVNEDLGHIMALDLPPRLSNGDDKTHPVDAMVISLTQSHVAVLCKHVRGATVSDCCWSETGLREG